MLPIKPALFVALQDFRYIARTSRVRICRAVHHLNADPAQLTRTNQLPLFGKKLSIQDDSLSRR